MTRARVALQASCLLASARRAATRGNCVVATHLLACSSLSMPWGIMHQGQSLGREAVQFVANSNPTVRPGHV
jgi:hypothetical protein